MKNEVLFSAKTDNWSTPKDLYNKLDVEFNFDFDPCPLRSDEDGLGKDWIGNIFINPPYSNVGAFLQKGIQELEKENAKILVYLLASRTDTKWFWDYIAPISQLFKDAELAWAAGLIDGEGCVFIRKNKDKRRKQYVYDLGLKVTMTDFNTIKRLEKIFDTGHFATVNKDNPKWKDGLSWIVRARKAQKVLEAILPYSITKREQIMKAIEFQKTFDIVYNSVPVEILYERENLFNMIKELKHIESINSKPQLTSEIRFIKGRLKFGDSKNSAPFPSMIVIIKAI